MKKQPICPSCGSDHAELLPGGVVYDCTECSRAFSFNDAHDFVDAKDVSVGSVFDSEELQQLEVSQS